MRKRSTSSMSGSGGDADPKAALRVALYIRVSTARQAEAELSIPDQIKQGQDYCAAHNMTLAQVFTDAGASATDDRRPEFQRMIEEATSATRPFDIVLVHSFSRFYRAQFESEWYQRKLKKAGVRVISITQEFADDPTGKLIKAIIASFDEYQSDETAKHTRRTMLENARQGFWNGSTPPFGYQTVVAEQRGQKLKKKLAVNEAEAATVRHIFDLALGRSAAPIGIKAIVNSLNGAGHRFRGKDFHVCSVHRILTATDYTGTFYFNCRDSNTGDDKPSEEWVAVPIPEIISSGDFDQVQASLRSRSPKRVPPRVVSGPTLLTGIAKCGDCGSGMTLRTGKSGKYRYYTCAGSALKGKTMCKGRSIPMAALDGMILENLTDQLLTPERLKVLLKAFMEQSEEASSERRNQLTQARRAYTEAEGRISRLLEMVEHGLLDIQDPTLKDRLDAAKLARHATADRVRLLEAATAAGSTAITPDKVERLATSLRQALEQDDSAFRKAYVRLFVGQVVVSDTEILVRGPTAALAKAANADCLPPAGDAVPSSITDWRPRRDSNPRPPD
jgi:site-specific DNA recombinase